MFTFSGLLAPLLVVGKRLSVALKGFGPLLVKHPASILCKNYGGSNSEVTGNTLIST